MRRAVEAMLALHESVGPNAAVTLIAPEPSFSYRPLMVAEPFGTTVPRLDLNVLTRRRGVRRDPGQVSSVEPTRRVLRTTGGGELRYDLSWRPGRVAVEPVQAR